LIHLHEGRVVAGPAAPYDDQAVRTGIPGHKWVMVIDLAKCDGCGSCTRACGKMHFIPPDRQWIKVFTMQDSPAAAPYYLPRPCFHCDNPPCTKVCPVDATYKRQDGMVLIDNLRCIGCRFCMAACPYSVRCFNWGPPHDPPAAKAEGYSPEWGYPRRIGTVEKCDFCPDMAADHQVPACDSGCPMGAIYFGDQNEDAVTNGQGETLRFSKLLRERGAYRDHEDLGTQPRCYYLPPVNRLYPAPDQAKPNPDKDQM
jgi:molybdopterin-containing oxidoreductase family iron-sulfur binding subunit